VERHCNFEPMNQPELFIFNYRFVPKKTQEKIDSIRVKIGTREIKEAMLDKYKMKQIDRLREINSVLNELNIELHKQQREEDESFVSRTMLDSPMYFNQDVVILRAITINPLTTPEIIKEIIEAQDRIGQKLYKSEFHNRLEKI
jgi:hypothetical protein